MDWFKKFRDRYSIITILLSILMIILSFKLAILTIAQGNEYRHRADNKRLKEIYTTAPRGEIRDRNGKLLAGNVPSFSVQLLKDELNQYDTEDKNIGFLKLIRLLEEDGVNYVGEFPIELNSFAYAKEEDYKNERLTPIDKVVKIIIDNNLVGQVLNTYYIHDEYEEHYKYITANSAINSLRNKGIEVPIDVKIENKQLVYSFEKDEDIKKWQDKYEIPGYSGPQESLKVLVGDDKDIIRTLADNSISSKLILDILKGKGLASNIITRDYSISYEDEYLNQKRILMGSYPTVTMNTSAKEDFLNIFREVSLKGFLGSTVKDEKDDKTIIPGEILIELLEDKDIDVPLEIQLTENEEGVIYNYTGKEDLGDQDVIDLLIDRAEENSVLEEFISSEEIRTHAQSRLLDDGVNPRISIADEFEYVAINNLNNFYKSFKIDEDSSAEEALESLRKSYKLDKKLSVYEIRPIFMLYYQLRQQGYLAYHPMNVAYGIKDSTVAKIEENLMDLQGIYVSVEPVRYYPGGNTAAHILGYLGKISQTSEIEKYVEEKEYSPDAIIGKTGVEESYEDILSGTSGIKRVEVDSVGNSTSILNEVKPIPGDNLYLSLDLDLQKVAEEKLEYTLGQIRRGGVYESKWGNFQFATNISKGRPYINAKSGAVVAIDVKTGEVLASASYPSYDPNLFSTGISSTDWQSLFPEDENNPIAPRPLLNIATQSATPPGSTFKMVTGLSALEKGLSPNQTIRDMGYITIGNKDFPCLLWTISRRTHGHENIYDALKDSCNYYFYSLGMGYNQKTGESIGTKLNIEDIAETSTKLGLNDKTGIEINIPSEASGGVPNSYKKLLETKGMLKSYLKGNIHHYYEEGLRVNEEEKEELIEEIASWIEYEEKLTRGEVIQKLEELKIEPEKILPGDYAGLADKIKYTHIDQADWKITDTLDVTIGQGRNSYTPIQMANHLAIIANGGYKHKLTLINSIKNYDDSKVKHNHKPNPERIELNDYENLEHLKEGMRRVSTSGTAMQSFQNFPVEVGTKTGTSQRAGNDDFSWFVGFAPYDDPEIAVVSVLFEGGGGGHGGPLVRDIMAEYLGLNEEE